MRKYNLNRSMRVHRIRHRGVAAVLAMLFLVLFAVLALGFFASVGTSVQTASNERHLSEAQTSAESMTQFMQLQLSLMNVQPDADPNVVLSRVHSALTSQMGGTVNMSGHNPSISTDASSNSTVYVPSLVSGSPSWMTLDSSGHSARAIITASGSSIIVKTVGRSGSISPIQRAIALTYVPSQASWSSPGKGVLTRSPISISNGAKIQDGDVMSSTSQNVPSLTMSGGAKIEKDFYYASTGKPPSISNGASVQGAIHSNATTPTFPTIDTSVFASFVPSATAPQGAKVLTASSSISSNAILTNIRIKANANISFGNSMTLNGVIYIESPNRVSFGGGSRVNGIIVTDNTTGSPLSGNSITVNNGVRIDTAMTLNPSSFPASEHIAELAQMNCAIILAPNYQVVLAGGSRTYDGTLVGSSFDISNGYRGTIGGNLICLSDSSFTMMGGGQLNFTAPTSGLAGLYGNSSYRMDPTSYREIVP